MSTNIYDRIEELSLAELEKLILSYWNNGKSSLITNQDDLEACLRKRCCLLPPCHVNNHLDDISRLNTLLTETALKLLDEADRIYRHVKNILQLPYTEICVSAKIIPSPKIANWDDNSGSDYTAMAEVLEDFMIDKAGLYCAEFIYKDSEDAHRKVGRDYLDCFNEKGEWDQSRGRATFGLPDLPCCAPFHKLVDHSQYSFQDIIRIQQFYTEFSISVEKDWD